MTLPGVYRTGFGFRDVAGSIGYLLPARVTSHASADDGTALAANENPSQAAARDLEVKEGDGVK